ncbi:MAG: stage II sporulation protein M [archaeon]
MNILRAPIDVLKKRNKFHYLLIFSIMLVLFINAFFSGKYLYNTQPDKAKQILDSVKNIEKLKTLDMMMEEGKYVSVSVLIFFNNFLIDVFASYSGIIFIFSILIPFSNVLLLGVLIGIQSMIPNALTLWRGLLLFIVAGMEVFCMILSTYEGLRIGYSIIKPAAFGKKKRADALKIAYKEASKILVLIAIILILAAIIETAGIAYLNSTFQSI